MRFKVNENLPAEVAVELRLHGHSAETVVGEGLAGVADPAVVEVARAEDRVLLTLDKGIANLLRYPKGAHSGVVLFRPGSVGRRAVLAFVKGHLPSLLSLDLKGRVTVVTDTRIRIR